MVTFLSDWNFEDKDIIIISNIIIFGAFKYELKPSGLNNIIIDEIWQIGD